MHLAAQKLAGRRDVRTHGPDPVKAAADAGAGFRRREGESDGAPLSDVPGGRSGASERENRFRFSRHGRLFVLVLSGRPDRVLDLCAYVQINGQ